MLVNVEDVGLYDIPLCLITIEFILPSTAFAFVEILSPEIPQSSGTGIYSIESNLIISEGFIVYRYFQIYPSPEVPADLGSRSINSGLSYEGLPFKFSASDPF